MKIMSCGGGTQTERLTGTHSTATTTTPTITTKEMCEIETEIEDHLTGMEDTRI